MRASRASAPVDTHARARNRPRNRAWSEAIGIRRATPELQADLIGCFEGDAVADTPRWRSCHCQFPLVDHAKLAWVDRRAA